MEENLIEPKESTDNDEIQTVKKKNLALSALKTLGKGAASLTVGAAKVAGHVTASTLSVAGKAVGKLGDALSDAISNDKDNKGN